MGELTSLSKSRRCPSSHKGFNGSPPSCVLHNEAGTILLLCPFHRWRNRNCSLDTIMQRSHQLQLLFEPFGLGGTKRQRNTFPPHKGLRLKALFCPGSSGPSAAPSWAPRFPCVGSLSGAQQPLAVRPVRGLCSGQQLTAEIYPRRNACLVQKIQALPGLLWPCGLS